MILKADMERDIGATFLNEEEFAEVRNVAGLDILCVMYAEARADGVDELGVEQVPHSILQARTDELPSVYAGQELRVDGTLWDVLDVREDYGMTSIRLNRRA